MLVENDYRGWSHSSLQEARVEFCEVDEVASPWVPSGRVALVVLPSSPEIGWGLSEHGIGELVGGPAAVRTICETVSEHDQLLEEQIRLERLATATDHSQHAEYIALREAARVDYLPRRLDELRAILGSRLQAALIDKLARGEPWQRRLGFGAETTFVSLAGRLGPDLFNWLHVKDGPILRVCEHAAVVFPAKTSRARFAPELERPPRTVRENVKQLDHGVVPLRVGPYITPADPFAPYALEVWSRDICPACGAEFDWAHAAQIHCIACGEGSARTARHRDRRG
jgi:hypothetical protein